MISASEREEFLLFRNKRGYGMEGVIMTIKRITDVSGDLKKIPVVLRREGAGDQWQKLRSRWNLAKTMKTQVIVLGPKSLGFLLFKWILGTMTCFEKWTPKLLPNLTLYHSINTCFAGSATGRRETFHLSADRIRSYHKKLTWATPARWWNRKPQAPILTWRHQLTIYGPNCLGSPLETS